MAENYGTKAASAAQRASDNGKELFERAKDQAQAAIDAGREGVEAVADEGRRQVESISGTIREWPLLSVAVAFAAGCAISRLLRR
jgi:hypothetical protein